MPKILWRSATSETFFVWISICFCLLAARSCSVGAARFLVDKMRTPSAVRDELAYFNFGSKAIRGLRLAGSGGWRLRRYRRLWLVDDAHMLSLKRMEYSIHETVCPQKTCTEHVAVWYYCGPAPTENQTDFKKIICRNTWQDGFCVELIFLKFSRTESCTTSS